MGAISYTAEKKINPHTFKCAILDKQEQIPFTCFLDEMRRRVFQRTVRTTLRQLLKVCKVNDENTNPTGVLAVSLVSKM